VLAAVFFGVGAAILFICYRLDDVWNRLDAIEAEQEDFDLWTKEVSM
jgi:hypothetical protein